MSSTKYCALSIFAFLLVDLLQAQVPAPPSSPQKPIPAPPAASSSGASVPAQQASIYYPYGCYYYGNNYGNLPNAQACSNSNGNQPNGNLQLQNTASMSYDNGTGTFLASSQTGNSASGDAASISSYTSANAYSPVNPAPISEVQISGSANSNGNGATGNLNNLDNSSSSGLPNAGATHYSQSQINGSGTGLSLNSNAQVNGNGYNFDNNKAAKRERETNKIFFQPNAAVRSAIRQKAINQNGQNLVVRQRTASNQMQKPLVSVNLAQNRRSRQ
ncbi:putative uncharacterized protein DDB_G0282133 [Paramacrobiotus metropolitanus]|uniref:putative uncharacterized protein DDB_G0282133 n=1 Tax=Paramacrobiotus metropolitanus TaxID=2943436 RepID=UPI002445FE14|nr:putative uncharacterized protein DDB_G0282133 [Paramacrobiotus metropolitanus]